jgi:hypothetical protein
MYKLLLKITKNTYMIKPAIWMCLYHTVVLSTCNLLVSEWLLFNAKWAIFQLYLGENKLHFNDMMTISNKCMVGIIYIGQVKANRLCNG